jgi:NAD kinase
MPPQFERKIVLVKRQSRLEELIVRFNSVNQARFYIEHLGADFSDYQAEHTQYTQAIAQTTLVLQEVGRLQILNRAYLPNYVFGPEDIVVVVGQDGLVANTLKYLKGQPLVGVNPDPARWDGVLLPFHVPDVGSIVTEVVQGKRKQKEVSMAEARLNNGQSLLGVNDLFIGQRTHVSARYQIHYQEISERHSSSGIIVSTGLGSTGWLKSILAGAAGVINAVSSQAKPIATKSQFAWDADQLYFSVREPFPSQTTGTKLVFGKITRDNPLKVTSLMAENGVIFSDGVETDFLEFNSGVIAEISLAHTKGVLVG